MFLWPSTTPGSVSTSMSRSAAFWCCGEVAHLVLGEADVVEVAGGKLGEAVADLGVGQAEVGAVPFVEADRQLAHRRVAARVDVGEDALDRRADLRIVLGPCLGVPAALEMTCHCRSPMLVRKP